MTKPLKPGELAPVSGQWGIVTPQGKPTGVERTIVRGEPMPPTPKPGHGFVLVDRTRTKPPKQ